MKDWAMFAQAEPELAAWGREFFEKFGMAYLATVRKDGSPRLHPVCPKIVNGHLFIGIIHTSPKRFDLLHDGRYVLHALPGPESAEFFVQGRARHRNDAASRAMVQDVDDVGVLVDEQDDLFELEIEQVCATTYEVEENDGQTRLKPTHKQWKAASIQEQMPV